MKTCYYYLLVEPVPSDLRDSAEAVPAFTVGVETPGRSCELAMFTGTGGEPSYARLKIPDVPEERLPEELLPALQAVKEHLTSSLRFAFHNHVTLFPYPMWTFRDPEEPPSLDIGISFGGQRHLDVAKARSVFVDGFPLREEFRLLVDAADARIPLQYRYLSAFKLIELEFKRRGRWRYDELDAFLRVYADRAAALQIGRPLRNYLIEMRDRCAHIRTGADDPGVTQVRNGELAAVERILDLLWDIAMAILNKRAAGTLEIGRLPKPAEAEANALENVAG